MASEDISVVESEEDNGSSYNCLPLVVLCFSPFDIDLTAYSWVHAYFSSGVNDTRQCRVMGLPPCVLMCQL